MAKTLLRRGRKTWLDKTENCWASIGGSEVIEWEGKTRSLESCDLIPIGSGAAYNVLMTCLLQRQARLFLKVTFFKLFFN